MPNVFYVNNVELPELQPYRVRKHTSELQKQGLFLAEGKRVVQRMLCSSIHTKSVLTTESVWEWLQKEISKERFEHLNIYIAPREFLSDLVGYDVQQPILALGEVPPDILPESILQQPEKDHLFVATDHLMNPDNLGVIIRNCTAFNVDLLITEPSSASPYYRRAVRNSMGTVFSLPVYHSASLTETLKALHTQWNVQIIGAHPSGKTPLHEFSFSKNACLVFGNEDLGISDKILDVCTHTVFIPLQPMVDSFNVANAAAIFLWEIFKQRTLLHK